jgi:transposase-like protein
LASNKHIQWSAEDKAAAYVLWISNEKNVRRTARECNIPHGTFRYWVKEWEENGPPDEVLNEIPAQQYEFVHHANRVRESAMNKLEELIPEAEVKQLSAIATVVGIMDDKIRLASGLATKRTETVHTLPSREDMKELMSGFVDGLVGAADARAGEIVDAEVVVEQPVVGLLSKGED